MKSVFLARPTPKRYTYHHFSFPASRFHPNRLSGEKVSPIADVAPMRSDESDRDLLFGLLALRRLIDRVKTCKARAGQRDSSLASNRHGSYVGS
jgi:hypothetical protein